LSLDSLGCGEQLGEWTGMVGKLVDAEMLVQGPSEIVFKDGLFHCLERYSDEFFIRKIYTPEIFIAAITVANAALAKWQREQQEAAVEVHRLYPVIKLTG
jgi:C4-dicarboxylate transporter